MKYLKYILALLFAFVIVVLAYATFLQQAGGAGYAAGRVYHSWWFFLLWALLAVISAAVIAGRRLWRRVPLFLLHVSFLVILLGAAVTYFTSKDGSMHIRSGATENMYYVMKDSEMTTAMLPFSLTLKKFDVEYYPGTQAPSDFVSYIGYEDDGYRECRISMNNILSLRGYRFYQSSFDEDLKGTVLRVNYDPYGTPVTYFGYCMFFISFLWLLVARRETFRRLLSNDVLKKSALVLVFLASLSSASARSIPTINKERAAQAARMQVIYNDRVVPLNTLARDFLAKIYGRTSYKGLSAEQVIYGWISHPEKWKDEKMIKIKSADMRRYLGIDGKYASMQDLFDGQDYKLQRIPDNMFSGNNKAVAELDEKVGLILMLTNGSLIKPLPKGGVRLSDARLEAELLYNAIPANKICFMANLTVGLLSLILLLLSIAGKGRVFSKLYTLLYIYVAAVFLFFLFIYILRWYIGGRIPLGNGYETMQFLALSVMLLTLIAGTRLRYILPFGLILSGFILLVSYLGEMNPQITPLMPVLNSPILSLHVSVIMMSYALLAFVALNALFALAVMAGKNDNTERVGQLTVISRIMLFPAEFLLGLGIFLGAVWANISWGSYWSWDPKEVWALITFMIYAVPFHLRDVTMLRRPGLYHLYMLAAFLAVLMTYFGVNYYMGGMHSYA